MSVQNKMVPIFAHYFTKFDINFLKNAWESNRGITWRSELKGDIENSI